MTDLTVLQEGDAEMAAKMQDLALAEGALPRHLHTAMFTLSTDSRMLTNRYKLLFPLLALCALEVFVPAASMSGCLLLLVCKQYCA